MRVLLSSCARGSLIDDRSEFLDDPENRIVRPFQVYLGSGARDYVPIDQRASVDTVDITSPTSAQAKRRNAAYQA